MFCMGESCDQLHVQVQSESILWLPRNTSWKTHAGPSGTKCDRHIICLSIQYGLLMFHLFALEPVATMPRKETRSVHRTGYEEEAKDDLTEATNGLVKNVDWREYVVRV